MLPPPMRHSDHAARGTSADAVRRLDEKVEFAADLGGGEHRDPGHAEHHRSHRAAAISTVHVTGAFIRSASSSLRILKAPALTTGEPPTLAASPNHPQRRRDSLTPVKGGCGDAVWARLIAGRRGCCLFLARWIVRRRSSTSTSFVLSRASDDVLPAGAAR